MDELYTVNQAATVLKVHSLTIRRYIKEGKLKAVRVGGGVRISANDLRSFIQDFVTHPKSPKLVINTSKELSFSDPLFKLKARGLSMKNIE